MECSGVALITGIRRLGFEIAKHLIDQNYNLAVVYKSSRGRADELKELADRKGLKVIPIEADLREEKDMINVVKEVENVFGRLDAFIHLASPYFKTPIEDLSFEDFHEHFKPIAEAFFFISLEAYRLMMKNEGKVKGRILAFGDWAIEMTPYRRYSAYFVSKGALHSAVKVLAKEFAPYVLVNCVALGPTMKAEGMSDGEWESILKSTPLRRPVSLDDLINITDFFLKTESVTGEIFMLDSGRHIAGSGNF